MESIVAEAESEPLGRFLHHAMVLASSAILQPINFASGTHPVVRVCSATVC